MADVRVLASGERHFFLYGTSSPDFVDFLRAHVDPMFHVPMQDPEPPRVLEKDDTVQRVYDKVYAFARENTHPAFTNPSHVQKCVNYIRSTTGMPQMTDTVALAVLKRLRKSGL